MDTQIQCSACRVRISAKAGGLVICPGCGARLRAKAKDGRPVVDGPVSGTAKKKKRRRDAGPVPNYALYVGIGGGAVILGTIAVVVALSMDWLHRPVPNAGNPNVPDGASGPIAQAGGNGAGQPPLPGGPTWEAKADPPKADVRPKDDLSIAMTGQALFASGQSPFVADLVPIIVGVEKPPAISVYDVRTGERTATAKAIRPAQSVGGPNADFFVALGPEGKTLAARVSTRSGTGRRASTTSEIQIYRLGTDQPVARFGAPQRVSWMEFGRDDDQLIVVSATANAGFSAAAYDLKQPNPTPMNLEIPRTPIRWRNGFGDRGSLAVSPGRTYLAVGEGRWVDLIRLSDGKLAGRCDLPGDCVSVAFSADGAQLAVHSHIAPPRKSDPESVLHQWSTFSLADGKRLSLNEVMGGPVPGPILAAGPKPGLAIHADRAQVTVTDTRYGAPVLTIPFPAVRCSDGDRLLGYDPKAKRVTVQRIDPERLAAGEKELAQLFGSRPAAAAADRTSMATPADPAGWSVPVDAAVASPASLVQKHTVANGAEFVMPWAGATTLSALNFKRVTSPRLHYTLQWQRFDLASGREEPAVELWPSVLPPGQVAYLGAYGSIIADQNADGTRLAVRDLATPARVDVWDQTGKRILGFLPYGPDTPVEALIWVADNRLITRGGGKVTGWEIPGPKAVFEVAGYAGAHAVSPGRKWIALQSEKHLDFYETATGKPLGRLERSHPDGKAWQGFAVSRDGQQLAALDLLRASTYEMPGVWAVATWDLKTGKTRDAVRVFGGSGSRTAQNPMWLGPRSLLAGGSEVIDLDLRAVTAALSLDMPFPLPSPDGRYWGGRSDRPPTPRQPVLPLATVAATGLDDLVGAVPKLAAADVVFRDGSTVEVVSTTGNSTRDSVIRSKAGRICASEGYEVGRGGWRLSVTGKRGDGTAYLTMDLGGKIAIPRIDGRIQLLDPAGTVAWETSAGGGFDMNHSKYKTRKEETFGPGGASITHFNFGFRDPKEAMAEEAWDNFVAGLDRIVRFPRVLARVNGKIVPLPIKASVKAK